MTALTPVATGVAGGREAPGGPDSPVESAPVASLSVEDATAAYHDAAQQVALRVAGGFPLGDTLERWETARAAFRAALDAFIAGLAVAEGNSPDGVVRPVEARAL